jgi:class 3 adenylate cyclase
LREFLSARPDVPEPVAPSSLRRATRYGALISVVLIVLNFCSRWTMPAGSDIAIYDRFLAINLPMQVVAGLLFYSVSRTSDPLAEAGGRLMVGLAINATAVTLGSWLVGGPSAGLNLLFAIVYVGFVRLYLTRRHGLFVLVAIIAADVLFGGLRLAGAFGSATALPSLELAHGRGLAIATIAWRAAVLYVMYHSASYAADRFRASEHALRQLNGELEARVREQVNALERAARLRRYLAPQLVEEVLSAAQDPVETRDRRQITIMFADLRGFTLLVERLAPDALAETLNLFFDEVARVAFAQGGTIDKFIGDCVMIFFGAPRATGAQDQARRCVRLALDVQTRVTELTPAFARLTGGPVEVRIGIASGVATVGAFGSSHRTDFTVVGAPVNRAARLEPLAVEGTVLIDEETRSLIGDAFTCERLADVSLKGFARPQVVYRVCS